MGYLAKTLASSLGGKPFFKSACSVQPAFMANFGGEAGLYQLAQNQVRGGANGGVIGAPAISANYVTCIGGGVSGIIAPFVPTGSFDVFIVARCLTWTNVAGNWAQLIGNYVQGYGGGYGTDFALQAALHGYYGYGGGFYLPSDISFATPPTGWHLYRYSFVLGTSLTTYDITDGTQSVGTSAAPLLNVQTPLQIGSYPGPTPANYDAPLDVAEVAIFNSVLGNAAGGDASVFISEIRARVFNKNGITV